MTAAQQEKDEASSSLAAASVRVGQLENEIADVKVSRGCALKPGGSIYLSQAQGCCVGSATGLTLRQGGGRAVCV